MVVTTMTSGVVEFCPRCNEPRIGLFCERCGHAYLATTPPTPSSWCAVIAPDRGYFETSGADTERFTLPAICSIRRIKLTGTSVGIGRHSKSRGTTPEIDLADPGVSHKHARLLAQPDSGWMVVDEDSANGTYMNGGSQPIPSNHQIPLVDGDRLHLGMWTTITLCMGT